MNNNVTDSTYAGNLYNVKTRCHFCYHTYLFCIPTLEYKYIKEAMLGCTVNDKE